jgi:hypothetical protein
MVIPLINNVYVDATTDETVQLVSINLSNLQSTTYVLTTLSKKTNVRNVYLTADTESPPNIYLTMTDEEAVFVKFDSSLNKIGNAKLLKRYGGRYLIKGLFFFNKSLFHVMGGILQSALPSKNSVFILRSEDDLSFSKYTCGLQINDFESWDSNYYPNIGVPVSDTTKVTIVTLTTVALVGSPNTVAGTSYTYSNAPLLLDAFSLSLHTLNFNTANANRLLIGGEQVTGFYKYPETNQLCYMYEVNEIFTNVNGDGDKISTYEFKKGSPSGVITVPNINAAVRSC